MINRFILTPRFLDEPIPASTRIATQGWQLNDPDVGGADQIARMTAIHEMLAVAALDAIRGGERPVSIAGDCCQTIAVVAGLQRAGLDPVIVWLDAHGDFNTPATTPSGFIGGMPLAMLTGRGDDRLMRGVGAQPIPERDIILADARDLDPGERDALERSEVRRSADLAKVPRMIPPGRAVYVHLDPDIIDPVDAPAMHYATKGGCTAANVGVLARALASTGQIVAASMSLWDLPADTDGRTGSACLGALHALVGELP